MFLFFFLSDITLVIKRLVKRETIDVKFELPGGTRDHEIKAGSNLRGEMIRLDVPVSFLCLAKRSSRSLYSCY